MDGGESARTSGVPMAVTVAVAGDQARLTLRRVWVIAVRLGWVGSEGWWVVGGVGCRWVPVGWSGEDARGRWAAGPVVGWCG